MAQCTDLGCLYNATGAQITGSYVQSTAFYADRGAVLNLFIEATADAGGFGPTSIVFKLQGRKNSTGIYMDLQTIDITTASQAVEHTYTTLPGAGLTIAIAPLNFDPRGYFDFVTAIKKSGPAANTNDNVNIFGRVAIAS